MSEYTIVKLTNPISVSNAFSDTEGDPASVGTTAAADGTSSYAARRDHKHAIDTTELDARYLKLNGSLAEISNHSHTVLTDIGTNTHAQIDTHIGDSSIHNTTATLDARYLQLSGGTMVGNITFNDNISALFGTGSDLELFHDGTNSYIQNNTGGIVIENDASNGDISFKVNDGGVDTTVMTIDGATGYVGIGTTNPLYKLHVSGTSGFNTIHTTGNVGIGTTTPNSNLHISTSTGDTITYPIRLDNLSANGKGEGVGLEFRGAYQANGANAAIVSEGLFQASANPKGTLNFYTAAGDGGGLVERLRIDSNGYIGIGTTAPNQLLHLYKEGNPVLKIEADTGSRYPSLEIKHADQSWRWYVDGDTDDLVLKNETDTSYPIRITDSAPTTSLYISGTGVGLGGVPTNKLSVTGNVDISGNVGIGTTSPTGILDVVTADPIFLIRDIDTSVTSANSRIRLAESGAGNTLGSYWDIKADGTMDSTFGFSIGSNVISNAFTITLNTGNVGIGTTNPTNLLSLGGNSARKFWMERHTTANTAGNTLTITAGGATSGATDKNGGDLLLQGGLATGTGESGVQVYGCVAGASGTTDGTQTLGIQLLGNKLGFYGVAPIARAVLATGAGATVDDVITALQNLGLVSQS